MNSLKNKEGWLFIDNRNSPGVEAGVMGSLGMPLQAGFGLFECATYTCAHCHSIEVIEPKRTRARAYCAKCDALICDACGAEAVLTPVHMPMEKIIDTVQETAVTAPELVLPFIKGIENGKV